MHLLHRGGVQARVAIDGRDHYLGVFDSPESKECYREVLAAHLGKQPCTLADELEDQGRDLNDVTVEMALAADWQHASAAYVDRATGKPKAEPFNIKHALRVARGLFGAQGTQAPDLPAGKFGPLKLMRCRQVLVDQGQTRTHVNDQVARIRCMCGGGRVRSKAAPLCMIDTRTENLFSLAELPQHCPLLPGGRRLHCAVG